MSYRFKLEALRRYRRFQEETLHKELSELQRRQATETMKLSRLVALRCQAEAQLTQRQAASTTAPQLTSYHAYLRRLSMDIASQRLELRRAEKACEQKRQALVLAMQKRKTLEKLKENGLRAYLQNLNQEEEKFINEMAINRFILNPR